MENAVYLVQKYANFGIVHYLVYHEEISHMCFFCFGLIFSKIDAFKYSLEK